MGWRGGGWKKGCYNTAIQSKKKPKKPYFNICILDSSILPLNHVKTQEENIKANEKGKKKKAIIHQYSKT